MNGTIAYALSKQYVSDTADSLGSLKGAPCTIKSQTETDDSYIVTFEWTGTSGAKETSQLTIKKPKDGIDGLPGKDGKDGLNGSDGVGISKIEKIGTVDLVDTYRITFTDNSTFDYEVKNGKDGQGGGTADVPIEKIKVNGELQTPVNKVVDITVPSIEGLTKDADLSTVAKSGSYEDLINKPTIPDITGLATETYVDNKVADYTKTVDLADVATSGSYNDLADKPTIPSLDGYAKTSEIPTKISELENDSNYLSSIPEEYVTETELSAKGYLTEHQDISGKVDKVEGKSLVSDTEIARLATVDNYDDTALSNRVKTVEDEVPNLATKTYVGEQITNAEHLKREIVTVLPSDIEASDNIIYMLKVESATGNDKYKEYMKIDGTVQMVGDTSVDLTDYAKSVDIPTTVAELTDSADYAKTADIPTTLPANGGNADTVNGHTVGIDVPENAVFTDTTYPDATQIEHGLMSVDDKKKLDGLKKYTPDGNTITADEDGTLHGVAEVTVDDALSDTSTNPVQNKVVKEYVDENVDFSTSTSNTLNDTIESPMLVTNATRNLLNPTLQTTTVNGVTCTNNGDGTYTLNGTATKGVTLYIAGSPVKNTVGGYKLVGCPTNGSNDTYRIVVSYYGNGEWKAEGSDVGNGVIIDGTYPSLNFLIKVESGVTVTNLVFKPMLTTDLSATYDDFVPYSGYDIKTCGKNIVGNPSNFNSPTVKDGVVTFPAKSAIDHDTYLRLYTDVDISAFDTFRVVVESINCTINDGDKSYVIVKTAGKKEFSTLTSTSFEAGTNKYISNVFNCSDFGNKIAEITVVIKKDYAYPGGSYKVSVFNGGDKEFSNWIKYVESSVHIDSTTEFPLFGLRSFDGITNIISPANVKCVYPTNESGKGVLDSLYNKDKMLTEQNKSLSVIGKCKNLLNATLQTTTVNGVTCTANGNGTYTLNGTATENVTFHLNVIKMENGTTIKVLGTISGQNAWIGADKFTGGTWKGAINSVGGTNSIGVFDCERLDVYIRLVKGRTANNEILKPMLTTDLDATYDDFVPYTGDGETLTHDVAEIKNDLGGLSFSASGTTLSITDGTHTWTLEANS